ncbi:MAG: hypothetical protein MR862_00740 [Clostridia bacterium]|nr:hypothetical protein [Clostridia bacterium]
MKKIFSFLLAICFLVPLAVVMTACGENEVVANVATIEELMTAVDGDNDVIKLTEDMEATSAIVVKRKVTFDLNGKTLTGDGCNGVIWAQGDAEVTITGDGKIVAKESADHYAMVIWAKGNSKVKIENGTFTQAITGKDTQYDMIYITESAQLTIEGGKFDCHTPKWTLNIRDKYATTAKFIVKGGEFKSYDPANVTTEPKDSNVTSFLPEGYKSTYNETTQYYTVSK